MEDDDLCARCLRDPGGVVEHPDRHVQLLPPLGVAHEPGDRGMDGEDDPVLPRQPAEALGPVVVHPELSFEVDLARGVAALEQDLDRRFRAVPRGHPCGPKWISPLHADDRRVRRLGDERRDLGVPVPSAVRYDSDAAQREGDSRALRPRDPLGQDQVGGEHRHDRVERRQDRDDRQVAAGARSTKSAFAPVSIRPMATATRRSDERDTELRRVRSARR